jgi:radical SAM protein with 4Fe4S-binding SPASM domain
MINRGGLVNITQKRIKYYTLASENLVIDYNGNVILCCNDYLSSVKLGNINNEKIIDIWNKKFYKKIRYELRKGIFTLDICKNELKLTNQNR